MARTRKGAKKTRALRVFFATDVHGSERCFRKFLAAAKVYEADVLLLGGDVAGKGLVPVYADNGALTAVVRGETVTLRRRRRSGERPTSTGSASIRCGWKQPIRRASSRPRGA